MMPLSKYVSHFGSYWVVSVLFFISAACQRPASDLLPTVPSKPDSSATTPPVDSVWTPKQVKISWSTTDFQEILYNASAQPVQYTSQYIDNQGTGHIQRFVYTLRYNAQKQVTQLDITGEAGSSYVIYLYNDNQVSQTRLYAADNRLLSTCTYQYSAPHRLSQVDEHSIFSSELERRTYQYNTAGNLSVITTYAKPADSESYALRYTLSFSEYDTQHDVENLLFHNPLLPNVLVRVNNHGLKILRDQTGRELSRERTTYKYNAQGYPIQQVRSGPGGSFTATYTY